MDEQRDNQVEISDMKKKRRCVNGILPASWKSPKTNLFH